MVVRCLIFVLLGLPALAAAQHRRPPAAPPGLPPVLGPIGLPLNSIGLPLPSIGLSPDPRLQPVHPAYLPSSNLPDNRGRHHQRSRQPFLYVGPGYGSGYGWGGLPPQQVIPQAMSVPYMMPVAPSGRLRIEVEPSDSLQLFVDGVYVGTLRDVGNEIDLPPGARRIELRLPGYQTLNFYVQITAGRSVTYRGVIDLDRSIVPAPPPPPVVVATGSRTMYVIPGCYLGNVPPKDVKLPAGCDLSRVTTLVP